MSNRLDKLFKDKLADHTLSPSANAWTRVEAGLSKKNNGSMLLRIAASVLLMGALVATLAWYYAQPSPIPMSKNELSGKKPAKETQPAKAMIKETAPVAVSKSRKNVEPAPKVETEKQDVIQEQELVPQIELAVSNPPEQEKTAEEIKTVATTEKIEKPIVLEYRLETVANASAKVTPDTVAIKAKSGFRKVIDFAVDAKNSEGQLGNLRQAKDDLFAFNFKKDKQKNAK